MNKFISLIIVAVAGAASAQVVLENTDSAETATKTWSITDLNNTNPTVSSENATATGTFTDAGNFQALERFSLIASARYGWNSADAQSAVSGSSFSNYLAGLSVAGIGAILTGEMGVDSSGYTVDADVTRFTSNNEVFVIEVDASSLSSGSLITLQKVLFQVYTADDRTDFMVYDASANTVVEAQWNANYNGSGDALSGSWTLGHGDQIIFATGSDNGSAFWRIDQMTFDATAGSDVPDTEVPTPNPATWASAPAPIGPFAIRMTATTGSDASGVEYFFAETSGHAGGTDSGWQRSPSYADTGLESSANYSYTVQMRDSVGNTGSISSVESATTLDAVGRTDGPPNVIIIYADDLGYADISRNASSGSLVHTPHIDRICGEGIYLENYMTHHVCSPSRSGLLTGRHYSEVGAGAQVGGTLDNSIPNIAKDFQAAGYATGAFGKWHNGNAPESDDGNTIRVSKVADVNPTNGINEVVGDADFGEGVNAYGFDEWAGFYGGGHDYHDRINAREIDWWINQTYAPFTLGYNTYIIRDDALKFIDDHAHEPFFLYIPNEAVHAPYDILNTDLEEMCNGVSSTTPSLAWSTVGELVSPATGRKIKDVLQMHCNGGAEFDREVLDAALPGFYDLVYYTMDYAMDKSTGQILDRLEAYGLSTNTIIVFAADNGGTTSGDNSPFRGTKHTLWEGGTHVAAAIWWPGVLDAHQAPYSPADNCYTNMTQYFDWYPTLVAAAGQTLTATNLDGLNLYNNLLNRTPVRSGYDECYYGLDDAYASIRNEQWKLLFNRVPGNQMLELYDMVGDISETTNVEAANPVVRDTMIGLLDAWFAEGDVSASYMPVTGNITPPYLHPAPEGDILEVSATQTDSISNPDRYGVYIRFAEPVWSTETDQFIHAGDVLQYDVYVADDSDHMTGIFVSPSTGPTPIYNSSHGIGLDETMLVDQVLPKGQWVRCVAGMGEVAPNTAYANFVALHNQNPGDYHFYVDNVVVRKPDGTVRAVVWSSDADTRSTLWYIYNKTTYTTLGAFLAVSGVPYNAIALNSVALSSLPVVPVSGSSYLTWSDSVGGIGGYDPVGSGPVNPLPLATEYAIGSDPTTLTEGLMNSTNGPTSQQTGTYAFQELSNSNYMTLTFDFNRDANDIEVVVAESSNLVDWTESLVLQPPYADTSGLASSSTVVRVVDNAPGSYSADTTRVTTRSLFTLDDTTRGFLKLSVRSSVPMIGNPELSADSHRGILLEWPGDVGYGEFIIERAASGSGAFSEMARTGNNQFTDTTAMVGRSYDYRVRANSVAGTTAWSNLVSVTR